MTRKLGFLGKKGFDIFGRNKLFAPRIKWDALKDMVQNLKSAAKDYEDAFNGIRSSVENKGNFRQVGNYSIKVLSQGRNGRFHSLITTHEAMAGEIFAKWPPNLFLINDICDFNSPSLYTEQFFSI